MDCFCIKSELYIVELAYSYGCVVKKLTHLYLPLLWSLVLMIILEDCGSKWCRRKENFREG